VGNENRQNKPPRLNSWRGGGRERGRGRGEGEERGGVEPGGVILSVLVSHDMCVPELAKCARSVCQNPHLTSV